MITDTLQKTIVTAMKARETLKVSTLRMLSSELKNALIDKGEALTEEEELVVVKKEAKKRRDAIEGFEKGGNKEAADNERAELVLLNEYLPEQMSDSDLEKLVKDAIAESRAEGIAEFGKAMPVAISKVAGKADGKRVADLVKKYLS